MTPEEQRPDWVSDAMSGEPSLDAPSLPDLPPVPTDAELESLRALLFKREIALLEQLRARLDDPAAQAKEISNVVAEALLLRAHKDDRLQVALEPLVENIFQVSLRKNPHRFTNVLFPVMGPALRKSIAETFRSMLESFNKSMEMSFSWKGLRWRLEAMRTGKPFSEIVLLHTLVYRVEQVFFIHSETGLEIAHAAAEDSETQDTGMVSAMLTAIQDFVRDCFTGGQSGELESLQHGEYTFLVEKDPRAYIACQIRGTPPAGFREQVRSTLENMLIEYAEPLESFSGDTEPFQSAKRYLDALFISRFVDEDKPLPLWVKALPVLLLLGLIGWFGFFQYDSYQERRESAQREEVRSAFYENMRQGLEPLRREPGLMIAHVEPGDTAPWEVILLKDDLARTPEEVLAENGVDNSRYIFRIIPQVSYERSIVARRVESKIHPPSTVTMRFGDDGTLYFSGAAPMEWVLQARQEALALPGVQSINMREVSDPRMDRLTAMVHEVQAVSIRFPLGKDTPIPEDAPKLTRAVETLVALEKLAADMGIAVSLTVYGHADATGQEKRNYEISQARARTIAAMLYAKGSSLPVALYGMGAEYAQKSGTGAAAENEGSRRIELRVHLSRAGDATPELLRR
ncbi:MAG: OmpA family protein [Desulfovibrionaceae bacterium]|nr:OmpA family protein [Desulfovibrionaceae bacterium]